jgi:hypothetical protein
MAALEPRSESPQLTSSNIAAVSIELNSNPPIAIMKSQALQTPARKHTHTHTHTQWHIRIKMHWVHNKKNMFLYAAIDIEEDSFFRTVLSRIFFD